MEEVLVSQMYSGSFIKEEIGHEIINFIKTDNGKHFIFINFKGIINRKVHKNIIQVLLVRRADISDTVEILAKVNVKPVDEKLSKILDEKDLEKQREYLKDFIKHKDIKYAGVFLDELFEDSFKVPFSPISYEVDSMFVPKNPLFITKNEEFNNEPNYIYIGDSSINARNLHWFYKQGTQAFKCVMDVINNILYWSRFELNAIKVIDNPADFLRIIKAETAELIYSNLFQFFFLEDKTVFKKFAKEILNVDISDNYTVEREESNIDLLIEDEKNIIVIENKIKSKINGVKYDFEGNQIQNQLIKYNEYAEKHRNGRKKGLFIFSPDYNNLVLEKYKGSNAYTKIEYSKLYEFFSNNRINHKYFEEFLFALKLHSNTYSNLNTEIMRCRFVNLINKKLCMQMPSISLEISNPCNERCVHCYRVCEGTKKGFLSAMQAKSVFEQAKALGASSVTITGGEALLNPEWKEIVSIADNLGFRISFFSNGSLMKESDADFLATIKNLKEVQFSLYALDEAVHDAITGVRGSCIGTKNAIQLMRERNIPLFVSCPVMKENKTAVLDVMRWCDDNGINSCADVFIFGDSDYSGRNLAHRLSWDELQDFYNETMKDSGRLSYVWGNGYGERDLSKIEFYGGAAHSLCVSGDGTIYPAIGWYEPLGNISTDKIADVFENHPLLKELRKIHATDIKECSECTCADFCEFCFSPHITANNGELGKVDAEFCRFVELRKKLAKARDEILHQES